jgi:hypothetical protein
LHNQVVLCITFTWDDSDDDFIKNDEFYVENINNFDNEAEIESFLSSLESLIHDSFSQKEIIERCTLASQRDLFHLFYCKIEHYC